MKKNIIILLLTILFPNAVYAACDAKALVQYQKLADNVTYETSYSKSANKFSVTFYNVVPGLYITDSTILSKIKIGHWLTYEDDAYNLNTKWVSD